MYNINSELSGIHSVFISFFENNFLLPDRQFLSKIKYHNTSNIGENNTLLSDERYDS